MERRNLKNVLEKVFLNDWSPEPIARLRAICALCDYYRDTKTPAEVNVEYRKKHQFLLAQQTLNDLNKASVCDCPRSFDFHFDARPDSKPDSFTFSPVIHIPAPEKVELRLAELRNINNSIKDLKIDIVTAYIKEKAVEAGDMKIE